MLSVPQHLCQMSGDCAVPSVVVGLVIHKVQVCSIRARTVPVQITVDYFSRSSCVYAVEVLVLRSLEEVGEDASDLTEVDLPIV